METYDLEYTKDEDQMLWEIHEIRHELQEEFKTQTVAEINEKGMKIFEDWKTQYQSS